MFRLNDPKIKWLFLTVGAMSILLSGPVLRISMAGWLLPIGVLYFMRASTILKGYLWTVLFMAIFMFIQGLFSAALPATASLVAAIISALLEALPYLLDRIFYKKVNSRFSIFLLPLLAVSYEYLISFPLSSIGVLAATQTDFLALAQLASITGVLGVSFMMYWLAAMVVSALLSETRISQFKLYGGVMFLILVFGFAKMRFTDPMQPTVKVAGISLEENTLYSALYEDFFGETVSFEIGAGGSPELNKLFGALKEFQKNPEDERFQGAFGSMKAFEDQLIQVTKQAALTDAKIIVWSETNLPVFKDREQEVLERVREIAMSSKTIVVTSMAVLVPYVEGGPMYENKSVVITAGGEFADYYEKARPVPFLDASLPGDGKLEVVSTPYGDLTTAICYDADFPDLLAQAGQADILILPANDWLGVSPFHGDYSAFRAIENGVSIVRPTGTGQSVIFDPHGRALVRLDAYDHQARVMVGHVPTQGVVTIFNYIRHGFVWLCMAAAIVLLGTAVTGFRGNQ